MALTLPVANEQVLLLTSFNRSLRIYRELMHSW